MQRLLLLISLSLFASPTLELLNQYSLKCQIPSDIHEHLSLLRRYAENATSVLELGVGESTWGLLAGLAAHHGSYIGVSTNSASSSLAAQLAQDNQIPFQLHKNEFELETMPVDLLFVDALHTYSHVLWELEKFSPRVQKNIILHDTSGFFETNNDYSYPGNHSEYPTHIEHGKRGVWTAVSDFLVRHPEWVIEERHFNNNGLTVLRRRDLNDFLVDRYPHVYDSVDLLPLDPQGWFNYPDAVADLIGPNTKILVEVGAWCGASTRSMARLLPEGGKVYAVDTFLGSIEHQEGASAYRPVLHHLYRQFLSNVIHETLEDKIIPIRLTSLQAAAAFKALNIRPDFIYIDGSHDHLSVAKDLEAWYPLLADGGIICGDNFFYGDIKSAVWNFALLNGLNVIDKGIWQLVKEQ